MIVRQISLNVSSANQKAFLDFWRDDYRKAMSAKRGFIDARLLKYTDNSETYQMLLEFASEEDSAGWRASAEHAALGLRLHALSSDMSLRVLSPVA